MSVRRVLSAWALSVTLGVSGAGCTTDPEAGAVAQEAISTNMSSYVSGDTVTVTYDNMEGATSDWISIAPQGSPDTQFIAYQYTYGDGTMMPASKQFANLPPGDYEARAYFNWAGTQTFLVRYRSSFTITSTESLSLTTNASSYAVGTPIDVTFAGVTAPATYDWVSIAPQGSSPYVFSSWQFTSGASRGTKTFATDLTPGNYVARFYRNNGYSILIESAAFTVTGANTPTPTLTVQNPASGQPITVNFQGMLGRTSDWISIAVPGSGPTSFVTYQYTGGGSSGSITFPAQPSGTYEVRAYFDWAGTQSFSVRASTTIMVACTSVETLCGGTCVDVQTSASNCGTCGHACDAGQSCTAGVCGTPPAVPVTHACSKRFGTAARETHGDVVVDASGAVTMVGGFEGSVDFGGGLLTSAGSRDIYVARFDASCNHVWSKRFGSSGDEFPIRVRLDSAGNIVLAGPFDATVNFGGSALTTNGSDRGSFIAKLSPTGAHVWSRSIGQSPTGKATIWAMDVGPNDAIVIGGDYNGQIDVSQTTWAGPGPNTLTSPTLSGISITPGFMAMLNADGSHVWTRSLVAGGSQQTANHVEDVAFSSTGLVAATGFSNGTIDFGNGVTTGSNGGGAFVAMLSASNTPQWARGFTSTFRGVSARFDGSDNVVFSGEGSGGNVGFGGGPLAGSSQDNAVFVVSFTSAGTHRWSKLVTDPSTLDAKSLAVKPTGEVLLLAAGMSTASVGSVALTSAGGYDYLLFSFDATGVPLTGRAYGDAAQQFAGSISYNPTGGLAFAGQFLGAIDLGGGTLTSAGSDDVFLGRYTWP